jgi:hypothetical protein
MANQNSAAFPSGEHLTEGLTKLEYAAIHICAAMIAYTGRLAEGYEDVAAQHAVKQAKALFKKLDGGE